MGFELAFLRQAWVHLVWRNTQIILTHIHALNLLSGFTSAQYSFPLDFALLCLLKERHNLRVLYLSFENLDGTATQLLLDIPTKVGDPVVMCAFSAIQGVQEVEGSEDDGRVYQ